MSVDLPLATLHKVVLLRQAGAVVPVAVPHGDLTRGKEEEEKKGSEKIM